MTTLGSDDAEEYNKINYQTYKLIKNIESFILECGGTIFGEYICHLILHDNSANKFFSWRKENNEKYESYTDKTKNPETYNDRNIRPMAIDCIMNIEQFKQFNNILKSKNIFYENIEVLKEDDNLHLINSNILNKLYVLHITLCKTNIKKSVVDFFKKNIENNTFKNNIVFTKEYESIIENIDKISSMFQKIKVNIFVLNNFCTIDEAINKICCFTDFYCNCLIMNKNNNIFIPRKYQELYLNMKNREIGNYVSPINYLEILNDIFKQITEKKAVSIPLVNISIKNKNMKKKGFEVIIQESFFELNLCVNDLCIICQENIDENTISVKLKCCSATYCFLCVNKNINKLIKNDKYCIMCNTEYSRHKLLEEWKKISKYYESV
jgi:hypothetical protein